MNASQKGLRNTSRKIQQENKMSWNPSNRTLEAFHPGGCPLCKGPIRVGQTIQRIGIGRGWKHYNCDEAAKDEKLYEDNLPGEEM